MSKYLYGASVQGIQSFIFSTNKLKDIVGASELVEQICTSFFEEFEKNGEPIVKAAGGIKYIFNNEEDCRDAVLRFPNKVIEAAPGITISQAVEIMEDDNDFERAVNALEAKLLAQRNKPLGSTTIGLMAMERSRQTGLPAIKVEKKDFLDEGVVKKREMTIEGKVVKELAIKESGNKNLDDSVIPYNISDLADKNNWIAIIHIDGNGLGNIIPKIGTDNKKLNEFSTKLDEATTQAAQAAYKDAVRSAYYNPMNSDVIPIRAIVLNGDDHTLICNAGIAIDYVKSFLINFEIQTKEKVGHLITDILGQDHLTACAGIAYVKASYPFHYGYDLAEKLCGIAKNESNRKHSCLFFHKVQSSFVEDFKEIERKELTTVNNHSLKFGPYFKDDKDDKIGGYWTIEELQKRVDQLASNKDGNATKSDIRQWLTLMHTDPGAAAQWVKRVDAISNEKQKNLFDAATKQVERDKKICYPAFDILSILDVTHKITKKRKEDLL